MQSMLLSPLCLQLILRWIFYSNNLFYIFLFPPKSLEGAQEDAAGRGTPLGVKTTEALWDEMEFTSDVSTNRSSCLEKDNILFTDLCFCFIMFYILFIYTYDLNYILFLSLLKTISKVVILIESVSAWVRD